MSITPHALPSYAQRVRWSLRYRGLGVTALSCLANLFRWTGQDWYWQYKERQFDRRHRVDTRGLIPIESLDVGPQDRDRGWGYMATQPEWFHLILSQLDIDYERYVFVDFGSGKGRALLLASTLPFKQVIGVEFCDALHRIAQGNIQSWRQDEQPRCQVRSVFADAATFAVPREPAVLYFYNPFQEAVMREVLANIETSHREDPRPLILIYANPTCQSALDEAAWLQQRAALDGEPRIVVYEAVGNGQANQRSVASTFMQRMEN